MNNDTRKRLAALQSKINDVRSELGVMIADATELAEEEMEKFENMTEGLQASEKGQAIEQAANALHDLQDLLESSDGSLEEAANIEVE